MRRTGLALLVGVALCLDIACDRLIAEDGASPPSPAIDLSATLRQERGADSEVRKSLQNVINVDFVDVPLKEALETIRDRARIPRLVLDVRSLQEEGINSDEPVNLILEKLSAQQALGEILPRLDLAWIVTDGTLRVVTRTKAQEIRVTRHYDLRTLRDRVLAALKSQRPDPVPTPGDAMQAIVELVRQVSGSEAADSRRSISTAQHVLIVNGTHADHDRIVALVRLLGEYTDGKLEHGHRQLFSDGYPAAADAGVHAALSAKTKCNFVDTPLKEAAAFFTDLHGVPVHLDERSLQEDGINTDEPVTYEADGVSLAAALRTMLTPLSLVAIVENGVARIMTETAANDREVFVLFDLRDLVAVGLDSPTITQMIMTHTSGPWAGGEGAGTIHALPGGGGILVTHNPRIQSEIALFLDDLRKSLGPEGLRPDELRRKFEQADQNRSTTKFYAIDRKDKAESLAAAVVEFVVPESWKANGGEGSIRTVGTTLVVRQTQEVHRAIDRFLRQLRAAEDAPPK